MSKAKKLYAREKAAFVSVSFISVRVPKDRKVGQLKKKIKNLSQFCYVRMFTLLCCAA
jgi:hypothetical protein